jgi:hypothetical protein
MFRFMKYGPYICIGVVLAILFVLWALCGGKNYEFVGLAPLYPDTCGSYTGSLYNWGNITPAVGYDPIEGHNCVPSDIACAQESNETITKNNRRNEGLVERTKSSPTTRCNFVGSKIRCGCELCSHLVVASTADSLNPQRIFDPPGISLVVDNTPIIPQEFQISDPRISSLNLDVELKTNQPIVSDNNPIILDYVPVYKSNITDEKTKFPLPKISKIFPVKKGRVISRGERLCCQTMENIYGVPFNTIRPDWLENPETGENLELDCYNDDLKLAVEYNGEQHYKWPNFTNQTHQQFINQVRRDTLKMDLCDRNGIYLIVVPYNISHDNIPAYIMSYLPETIQKRLQEEKILSNIGDV